MDVKTSSSYSVKLLIFRNVFPDLLNFGSLY